jgi:hypothetical protein
VAGSHLYRFANEALPENVFDNPLAFSRGIANPLKASGLLAAIWDRAGGRLAGADRVSREGMTTKIVRVDPFTIVHLQPPFARESGDPCTIVVVGKGDGENQFDDVKYFVVELTADGRFALVERKQHEEHAANLGEAPPDVSGILEVCIERAHGREPSPRDRVGTIAPWYWWHVCRGPEVMRAFANTPEHEAWGAIHQHPILLLPELVESARLAGGFNDRAIGGLAQMHASLRGTPHFAPFQRLLATALASARGGNPRVNIDRALAVLAEARASASGADLGRAASEEAGLRTRLAQMGIEPRRNYERARELYEAARKEPAEQADRERDERDERAVATALASLAPPPAATTDPTWSMLFLDENELAGFQRREDRRDENPNPNDRSFAELRGIGAGSVVWLGNEAWPMWRVIDTRWLFPSVANATAFADQMVAHAGEGLPSLPVPNIGDAARGWGGIQLGRGGPGSRYAGQIVFFRVGRMVAKLFAAEGPAAPQAGQALAQSMLFPYAEAIVRRAQWALPRYWLGIARGTEAANVFVQTPPSAAVALLSQYPILALPEFPAAMATLGDAHAVAAQALWSLQSTFKTDYSWRNVVKPLVRSLLDDRIGEPRVNAHAALALVLDMRRVDNDPAWAQLEAECRARA